MTNKINKKVVCLLALFQIILLVNAIIAQPYLIHQTEKSEITLSNLGKKQDSLLKQAVVLLSGILSIKQIGTVSAVSITMGCCTELKTGEICEDLPSENANQCKNPLSLSECYQLDSCKLGCCRDSVGGICSPKSPKGKCTAEGGVWDSSATCQTAECQKGCCVLGGSVQFVNEKTCESLSILYGFEKDFKDLDSEIACRVLAATQEIGACISSGGGCSFKTEKECIRNTGNFNKGYLCSEPSLETSCTKQASIGCVDGKDEIYWFDSCENVENIYSSDKTTSWNNGKVLAKEQSCNPSSPNINSTSCGNCNRALSSVCSASADKKIEDGNFVCKSLECKDAEGNIRKNGESWCVYDSYIGDGKDTVGSEHWRAYCHDGDIETELCGAYRGGICVQTDMESNGKTFSIAACNANDAATCVDYNSEKDTVIEECQENKNCIMKQVRIDDQFYFDLCTPRYPKGFDTDLYKSNKGVCTSANAECPVVYVKDWKGRWKCNTNCRCETKAFSDQMNDLCIGLGDCGSYINFVGNGTNNTRISGAPPNNWSEYLNWGPDHIDYSKPVKGQYGEPQDLTKLLESFYSGVLPLGMSEDESTKKATDTIYQISGAGGLIAAGAGWVTGQVASAAFSTALSTSGAASTGAFGTGTTAAGVSSAMGAVAYAAIGAALGAMVGSWLADSMGTSGTPATIMTISWAIAGAAVAYAVYAYEGLASFYAALSSSSAGGPYAIIVAVIIAVVVTLWVWLSGWGKTETRMVSFKCLPWEAPLGGDDCTKCNDNPQKPCTEYRCESLGQACVLLNNQSETPECKSIPKENIAPIISPGEPDEGYKFENISQDGLNFVGEVKKCIQEFTSANFSLKTDEHAQCVYSFKLPSSMLFEDMEEMNDPEEGNAFTINHTFKIKMPSIDSLYVHDLVGDLREKFGDLDMYVRCRDYWGNYNLDAYIINFCVNSGPDITSVNHLYTTMLPKTGTILKYGTTDVNVSMYINEPAECKYSNSSGKNYDEMENPITCETEVLSVDDDKWKCNMTMPISQEENKIYIRCKDQPWFAGTINETNRNANQDDYEYVLYASKSELNITGTYTLPGTNELGIIENGIEPFSIEIGARTSDGAKEGVAICYWGNSLERFWETDSTIHKQPGVNVMSGTYSIPVKCKDVAENIATTEINFSVELDTAPPIAVRAYRQGSELIVLTDEKAECYYDFHTCNFDIANATSMTTALSITHKSPWEPGKTYHIKCKDIWGNTNPWCAIRVQPE